MHILSHFAYLDAGTGSLIIQSVIGILAGVAVFWRKIVVATKAKFGSLFGKAETAKKTDK